jgi:hypothetical protein
MLHPAAWIAAWGVIAIVLQVLEPRYLLALALPTLPLAIVAARHEVLRLLGRARWLLLAVGVLFLFATPGERLPAPFGGIGMTFDGLVAAGEHVLRLVMLLATLAWLWQALGSGGLLSGLHCLLRPLGSLRNRIVVRLVLALEYVERERPPGGWRAWLAADPVADAVDPAGNTVRLSVAPLATADRLVLLVCAAALLLLAIP